MPWTSPIAVQRNSDIGKPDFILAASHQDDCRLEHHCEQNFLCALTMNSVTTNTLLGMTTKAPRTKRPGHTETIFVMPLLPFHIANTE